MQAKAIDVMMEEMFAAADKNKDSKLSKKEVKQEWESL